MPNRLISDEEIEKLPAQWINYIKDKKRILKSWNKNQLIDFILKLEFYIIKTEDEKCQNNQTFKMQSVK